MLLKIKDTPSLGLNLMLYINSVRVSNSESCFFLLILLFLLFHSRRIVMELVTITSSMIKIKTITDKRMAKCLMRIYYHDYRNSRNA